MPAALSIVIPVYRGAATIADLVQALARLQPAGGLDIILVNDGSPDESAAICRRLVQEAAVPITYVEHTRNFGEHNAVMSGLRLARGQYVITMDDDLQNPPEEVVRLFDHARLGGWDVVYTRYAVKHHAPWRNLGSRFANKAADWLIDKPDGLYLSSFRCMSALAVGAVTPYFGPYPYVDGLLMQVTQRIDSIEVRHLPRAHGVSSYNFRRLVRLWLNLATSFSLAPLRLATIAGAVMALVGTGGAIATILEALTNRQAPTGWASTMTVILLVSGVQSMILGVLGEYVGRTFLSSNGKPQGIVRRIERSVPAALDPPTPLSPHAACDPTAPLGPPAALGPCVAVGPPAGVGPNAALRPPVALGPCVALGPTEPLNPSAGLSPAAAFSPPAAFGPHVPLGPNVGGPNVGGPNVPLGPNVALGPTAPINPSAALGPNVPPSPPGGLGPAAAFGPPAALNPHVPPCPNVPQKDPP